MPTQNSKNLALTEQVELPNQLTDAVDEQVWIEVIQQMDAIYADLIKYQVELEEKNTTLQQTYQELQQTHEALKKTQQQLVQSEKMASLGRLVAGVAHELNNPISFILGNTHVMERYSERLQSFFKELDKLSDQRIGELRKQQKINRVIDDLNPLVDGTLEGAQRVGDIVESLLRFTTPQQRDAAEFELTQLIRTAEQWVMRAHRAKPVVHYQLPEKLQLKGHEGSVHQILVNLINNAADACEKASDPTLWIQLEYDADIVTVSVRDNGAGIDPENLANIFDPFFTTKDIGKGTGLGLYISYLLATDQCRGSLVAENHRDGGAIFRLTLPLNEFAESADA